jgi:hypothetical protein
MPVTAFADMQFFLSSSWAVYDSSSWTSDTYPDATSGYIWVEYTPSVMPVANEYIVVDSEVKELFETITTQSGTIDIITEEIEQFEIEEYEILISTENPQFIEYITTSINPETEIIIEEKINQNIVLTPFEQVFYNCNISLEERQEIVLDVLERIASWEIENLENITYSNPSFWDCIIPFPDVSHRETVVENSFVSNQLVAKTLLWEETNYQVHESIENIITQENEYQELIIEDEFHYSQLVETWIITESQYETTQDIQSYYRERVLKDDISYDSYFFLVEEFENISDINKQFWNFLKQWIITQEEYDTFLEELNKIIELQKHFFSLYQSWEISLKEYHQYIREWEMYLQEKKKIIESYKQNEINLEIKNKSIAIIEEEFNDRYSLFSDYFENRSTDNSTFEIGLMQIIYMSLTLLVLLLIMYIYTSKSKKPLWRK